MADTLAALPPLRTDRLRLRPLGPDDAAALQEMTDHPAVTGPIHFLPAPFTVADATGLILGERDGRDCFVGAWDRGTAALVAVVGTHLRGIDEIEIGYWVRPGLHGRGLAAEAVSAVLAAVRQALPQRRIYAECRVENTASWHLLGKLGFRPDGAAGQRPGRRRLTLARRAVSPPPPPTPPPRHGAGGTTGR